MHEWKHGKGNKSGQLSTRVPSSKPLLNFLPLAIGQKAHAHREKNIIQVHNHSRRQAVRESMRRDYSNKNITGDGCEF